MEALITGAFAILLAGSASSGIDGAAGSFDPARLPGAARAEVRVIEASMQDAEALLKRFEQLAARLARLEEEVGRLETRNKLLTEQLKGGVAGSVGAGGGGAPGSTVLPADSVRNNPGPGSALPGQERKNK